MAINTIPRAHTYTVFRKKKKKRINCVLVSLLQQLRFPLWILLWIGFNKQNEWPEAFNETILQCAVVSTASLKARRSCEVRAACCYLLWSYDWTRFPLLFQTKESQHFPCWLELMICTCTFCALYNLAVFRVLTPLVTTRSLSWSPQDMFWTWCHVPWPCVLSDVVSWQHGNKTASGVLRQVPRAVWIPAVSHFRYYGSLIAGPLPNCAPGLSIWVWTWVFIVLFTVICGAWSACLTQSAQAMSHLLVLTAPLNPLQVKRRHIVARTGCLFLSLFVLLGSSGSFFI